MTTLHSGQQVKSGGASRSEVKEMLRNVDGDKDGNISNKELEDLANKGRKHGFSDDDSLKLFHAGLDAGGLAEVKSREPGQQLSKEYIDKKMKPLLSKSYGKNGNTAADLVAPQASRELTKEAADRMAMKADPVREKAISQALGPNVVLMDTNEDGRVDAKDRRLAPNNKGGYNWSPIGKKKADEINATAGLAKGAKALDGVLFPNTKGNPPWAHHKKGGGPRAEWMGSKKHADGGAWRMTARSEGKEYKLDTSRMKPSAALDHIRDNPEKYCMDCSMGKQYIQYQRVREMLGDEKFNEMATKNGMTIGHSNAGYRSGFLSDMTGKAAGGKENMPLSNYTSGWQGYAAVADVGNTEVLEKMQDGPWSGEHFTVAVDENGQKMVHAHPFGTMPLNRFERELKDRIAAEYPEINRGDIRFNYSHPLDSDVDHARRKLN